MEPPNNEHRSLVLCCPGAYLGGGIEQTCSQTTLCLATLVTASFPGLPIFLSCQQCKLQSKRHKFRFEELQLKYFFHVFSMSYVYYNLVYNYSYRNNQYTNIILAPLVFHFSLNYSLGARWTQRLSLSANFSHSKKAFGLFVTLY